MMMMMLMLMLTPLLLTLTLMVILMLMMMVMIPMFVTTAVMLVVITTFFSLAGIAGPAAAKAWGFFRRPAPKKSTAARGRPRGCRQRQAQRLAPKTQLLTGMSHRHEEVCLRECRHRHEEEEEEESPRERDAQTQKVHGTPPLAEGGRGRG